MQLYYEIVVFKTPKQNNNKTTISRKFKLINSQIKTFQ